jgi:urease accessory protein
MMLRSRLARQAGTISSSPAGETAELRAEDRADGLLASRGCSKISASGRCRSKNLRFPRLLLSSACAWGIDPHAALQGYLWTWLENQAMAAVKSVPLGQTEAQAMLLRLGGRPRGIAKDVAALQDEDLANFTPGLAILSARHETQYSRLFRS